MLFRTTSKLWLGRKWQWVPHEVKYYVARTGSMIGLTQRNYKRYIGTLLETHWTLEEIELGVYDKVYDTRTGEYYFEKKIVKMKIGGIIDIQWIAERKSETELLAEKEEKKEEKIKRKDITKEQLKEQLKPGSNV